MDYDTFRDRSSTRLAQGSWFRLPNRLLAIDPSRPDKERPVIWPGGGVMTPIRTILPRTTKGDEGTAHLAHIGLPDHPGCALDLNGWILPHRSSVALADLTDDRFSCVEPDLDLVDALWAVAHRR